MRRITAVIVCLTLCSLLHAAEPVSRPLALEDCLTRAQQRNETLRAQAHQQDAAGERLTQARGGLLPGVRFSAEKTFRDTAGSAIAGAQTVTHFTFSQPLFAGFKKTRGIHLARGEMTREALLYRYAERTAVLRDRARLGKSRESEALMTESQLASLAALYEKTTGDYASA